MRLSNKREVLLMAGCILETEEEVYIVCEEQDGYRLLNMECGKLSSERYESLKEIGYVMDKRCRRIVYDGVVEPDKYIDVNGEEKI